MVQKLRAVVSSVRLHDQLGFGPRGSGGSLAKSSDEQIKDSAFAKWVLPSVQLAVSKPLSWALIVLGALSLFNMAKNHFGFELFFGTELIDTIYAYFRDAVVVPIEWATGLTLPEFIKNLSVLYVTMARTFSLAFGAIKESLGFTGTDSLAYWHNHYPPIDGSVLKRFVAWERWVRGKATAVLEGLFGLAANFVASFFWPIAMPVLLKHPTILEVTGFDSQTSTITPGGEMSGKSKWETNVELRSRSRQSEMFVNSMGQSVPIEPETRQRTLYNTRVIIGTFLVAQLFVALVLVVVNVAGLYFTSAASP